jgi:protein-S-isoprenylcysteine O-methyltransferase Ste14
MPGVSLKNSTLNRGIPAGNPIANLFVIVVGALVIGVSVVLGFVAFVVLGSVLVVLAGVIGLRLWWFNRKLRSQVPDNKKRHDGGNGGVIEGEFQVLDDSRDGSRENNRR